MPCGCMPPTNLSFEHVSLSRRSTIGDGLVTAEPQAKAVQGPVTTTRAPKTQVVCQPCGQSLRQTHTALALRLRSMQLDQAYRLA